MELWTVVTPGSMDIGNLYPNILVEPTQDLNVSLFDCKL